MYRKNLFHIFQTELTTELSINVMLSIHFGQLNMQNSHINMLHHKICQLHQLQC